MNKVAQKFTVIALLLFVAFVLALSNGNVVDFLHNLQSNSDYLAVYKDIRFPGFWGGLRSVCCLKCSAATA